MENHIHLSAYHNEKEVLLDLIQRFWIVHNDETPSPEEALEDFHTCTGAGHQLFFIKKDSSYIGLLHLGSRGAEINWVEELFILPEYQGHGYGSMALKLAEDLVREYSDSIYLEVAAFNFRAAKLYRRNGYDCLNTVTLRKDFQPQEYKTLRTETLFDHSFEIKQRNKKNRPS